MSAICNWQHFKRNHYICTVYILYKALPYCKLPSENCKLNNDPTPHPHALERL
jgi:hypothetical protein